MFPAWCAGCNQRLMGSEQWLCAACRDGLRFNENHLRGEGADWTTAAAVFSYTPAVRRLIHQLKYEEATRVARFLGQRAVCYMHEVKPFAPPDYVVPVPLHSTRKRERGYNQALLLARELAAGLNSNLSPSLVRRRRHTQSQTHLDRTERQTNVAGAFERDPAIDLSGRTVLVVDDVFTTGATVSSVAAVLMMDGKGGYGAAQHVFVLTIARA